MHDVEPVGQPEQPLASKMRRRAVTGRGVAVFAWIGLQQREQFRHVFDRQRRIYNDPFRCGGELGHRHEAIEQIVRDFGFHDRLNDDVLIGD
jgi:hypothetical protein